MPPHHLPRYDARVLGYGPDGAGRGPVRHLRESMTRRLEEEEAQQEEVEEEAPEAAGPWLPPRAVGTATETPPSPADEATGTVSGPPGEEDGDEARLRTLVELHVGAEPWAGLVA